VDATVNQPLALQEGTPDDAELVVGARAGSRHAFEQLYRRHSGDVYGLCLRLTGRRESAEDCTQETFIAAWRGLARFEARAGLATWLHRIAVNTVVTRHRAPAARLEALTSTGEDADRSVAGIDMEQPLDLERAIAGLPEGARHVLVLVGIYGHTHAEAGAMLGVAEGTCKAQLHRARALLAQQLNKERQ
jgi:RNA polymerase sigma-70 factor (ECF subfamily)